MKSEKKIELPQNRIVIKVTEAPAGSDQFVCDTGLSNQQTANILFKLARQYQSYAAIESYQKELQKKGSIISPHTGQFIPN